MSTVMITGAGSGIGRALAAEADRHGHDLILVGRRAEPLRDTAGRLSRPARIIDADITTAEGRARIRTETDRLDILINNAGQVPAGALADLDDATIAAAIAVNVAAPISLTRDLLPLLTTARGQVVNMGSVFGDIGFPFFTAYSSTKFALRGFSEALRREVAPKGIAVTYIAPRATHTAAMDGFHALVGPMAMTADTPEAVARHAWAAIAARRRDSYPPTRERLFVALQRLRPRMIDRALTRLARDPQVIAAARDLTS